MANTSTTTSPSPISAATSSLMDSTPLVSISSGQVPLKLTPHNFTAWRGQLESFLFGWELLGYLDGTHPCPPPSAAGRSLWLRQDQFILHGIRISLSDPISNIVALAQTSKEAWDKLTRLYANRSRSRVMSLKERLGRPRDYKPVAEYLQQVKTISDELALIDAPLSDDDLVIIVLNGLGPDFKEISAGIRTREHPMAFEDLHDLLVDYEASLRRDLESPPVLSAHSTFRSSNNNNRCNSSHGNFSPRFSNSHQNHPSSSRGNHGHSFQKKGGYKGFCQLCDQQGHRAKQCPRAKGILGSAPNANCTSTSRGNSQPWLVDSAATNHVTGDLANLSLHSEYDGPDDIIIGDGSGSAHGGHHYPRAE